MAYISKIKLPNGSTYDIKAVSASKLTSSAGSSGTPVYFKDGVPVACNASIGSISSGVTAIRAQMPFSMSGFLKI